MKQIPTSVQNLFNEGRIAIRSLIKAEFGTGTYGFWNGTGDLPYGGVTYWENSLIRASSITSSKGLEAHPFELIMPAANDLTPDKLATIESEDYKGRKITLMDAFFEPDTRNLLHVEVMLIGYLDVIDHRYEDGEFNIIARCETNAIENHIDGYRTASDQDQKLIDPTDKFFQYASLIKTEKHWFGRSGGIS